MKENLENEIYFCKMTLRLLGNMMPYAPRYCAEKYKKEYEETENKLNKLNQTLNKERE